MNKRKANPEFRLTDNLIDDLAAGVYVRPPNESDTFRKETNVRPGVQFSMRMRKLREERGMTQEELAAKADLSARAVHDYEKGKHTPRKNNLLALAAALEVPLPKLCPFYSFATLKELLHERFKEEIDSLDAFVDCARPPDLERLEQLLRVYDMSTGMQKLEVDFVIHRAITAFGQRPARKRLNTLILQFFSQIDEFVEESGLLDSANEDVLADIHLALGKAALDKDTDSLITAYMRHLHISEEFVFNTFGVGDDRLRFAK